VLVLVVYVRERERQRDLQTERHADWQREIDRER